MHVLWSTHGSQIHPIPPYDNATVFEEVLNKTVELGLYLIYDMRLCVVILGLNCLFILLLLPLQVLPELD